MEVHPSCASVRSISCKIMFSACFRLTKGSDAIEHRSANQHAIRAQRQCFHHIGATAKSTVDKDDSIRTAALTNLLQYFHGAD